MSSLCGNCAATTLPKPFAPNAVVKPKKGGLMGIIASTLPFPSIVGAGAEAAWLAAITACTMAGRIDCNNIKGSKPAPKANTSDFSSCGEPVIVDYTETWNIADIGATTTGSISEWYSTLRKNASCLYFAFINCEDEILIAGKPLQADGGLEITDKKNNPNFESIVLTYTTDGDSATPQTIPFLAAIKTALQTLACA